MSGPGTTSVTRLEQLISDAFRLRRIIAQNTYDKLLSEKVEFRYWVDTPIFFLFAQPGQHHRLVSAFPSLAGIGDDSEFDYEVAYDDKYEGAKAEHLASQARKNALFANALLTGEFIFKLAGHGSGNPVLVSPEHANEIYSYIAWLERRSRSRFGQSAEQLGEVYSALQDLLMVEAGAAQSVGKGDEDWLHRVRQSIVNLLSEASSSPLLAPYRLWSLFSRGAIANAALALGLPDEVISPPYETLSYWRTRIQSAKRSHRVLPSRHALDADAVTLAQLQFANENWRDTGKVCVLITSDQGLHRAYFEWQKEAQRRNPKQEVFYALRDPRQYAPILNVSDMPGQYTEANIFKKVEDSVKEFISSFSSNDLVPFRDHERDPSALPDSLAIRTVINDRMSEHAEQLAPFADQIWNEIENIGTVWVEAIEYSVAAKTDVISELAHRDTQLWRRAKSRQLLDAGFSEQIEDVRMSFEKLATSSTLLRQEIWALEHGPPELSNDQGHSRRSVASEFSDYRSPMFAGKALNEILADLRRQKAAAIPLLRETDRGERLFVTGCLSLQIGAWAGAKSLLDRAAMLEDQPEQLIREVRLFHCMARRLGASLRDYRAEYAAVRKSLESQREKERGRPNREDPRVRNEQLALELCELAFVAYENKDMSRPLRSAGILWQRMKERFRDQLTSAAADPLWQAISRQFVLNSCNLLFWTIATGADEVPGLRKCVGSLLEDLDESRLDYITESVHGRVYPMLARYALARSESERAPLAAGIGVAIKESLSLDETRGFAFDDPFVDKAEFVAIMERLDPAKAPKHVRLW